MEKKNEVFGIQYGTWIILFIYVFGMFYAINLYGSSLYGKAYNRGWFDKLNNKTHLFLAIEKNKKRIQEQNYSIMDEHPCHPCYDENNILINSTDEFVNFSV